MVDISIKDFPVTLSNNLTRTSAHVFNKVASQMQIFFEVYRLAVELYLSYQKCKIQELIIKVFNESNERAIETDWYVFERKKYGVLFCGFITFIQWSSDLFVFSPVVADASLGRPIV